jgi:hypothetical protein
VSRRPRPRHRHWQRLARMPLTNCLGMSNGLGCDVVMFLCLLPRASPRLSERTVLGELAPLLHRHPSEQRLLSYYRPVRQRTPPRYSVPLGSASGTLPLAGRCRQHRRPPSHVPHKSSRPGSRRLHAGHRLASERAPARLIPRGVRGPSVLMPSSKFRRVVSDARPTSGKRFWNAFLVPT